MKNLLLAAVLCAGALAVTAPPVFAAGDVAICGTPGTSAEANCILPNADGSVLVEPAPSSASAIGIAPVVSASSESNHVLKASPGNLYGFSATIGTTSGYVMLFDATTLPSNGAVTPKKCYAVTSNGTNGTIAATWQPGPPLAFATGITIGFSTTGCFTLTASATAFFSAEIK